MKFTLLTLNVEEYHRSTPSRIYNEVVSCYNPDVICLQEDTYSQYATVQQSTSEGIYNSIYTRVQMTHPGSINLDQPGYTSRCAVYGDLIIGDKIIRLVNTHLTGGRFDDKRRHLNPNARDLQISKILTLDPDLVVGDFNSHPPAYYKNSYHPFEYITSGHQRLIDAGYKYVPVDRPTSIYGSNPDWIYYKSGKIKCCRSKVVMALPKYTDHNGILVVLEI